MILFLHFNDGILKFYFLSLLITSNLIVLELEVVVRKIKISKIVMGGISAS